MLRKAKEILVVTLNILWPNEGHTNFVLIRMILETANLLFSEKLKQGFHLSAVCKSVSMSYLIRPGDTYEITWAPHDALRRGDIVVIDVEHSYLAHRLIYLGKDTLQTRGDFEKEPDPSIEWKNYVGKVTHVHKWGFRINLCCFGGKMLGFLFLSFSRMLLWFSTKRKTLLNTLCLLASVALAIWSVEYFADRVKPNPERRIHLEFETIYHPDSQRELLNKREKELLAITGRKIPLNATIHHHQTFEGQPLWDVQFHIDSWGRRITPAPKAHKNRFLAFFGCSFTFGYGVEDSETALYYLSQKMPNYQPYNYGVPNAGPEYLLSRISHFPLSQEIKEREGFVYYFWIDSHLDRLLGTLRYTEWGGRPRPLYALDSSGRVIEIGNSLTATWPRLISGKIFKPFARWLEFSSFLNAVHFDYPYISYQNGEYAPLVGAALNEIARKMHQQIKFDKIRLVLLPSSHYFKQFVSPHLDPALFETHDYSDIFQQPGSTFPGDGHPTSKGNHLIAERIMEDL